MSLPGEEFRPDDLTGAAAPAAYPLGPYRNLDYPHVFLSRAFVQTTLPHSRPAGHLFVRENGNLRVTLISPDENGLPYGTTPRLVLMWICTQVCALKQRTFEFPDTFYSFLRLVGVNNGGRSAAAARSQMEALFRMSLDVTLRPKGPALPLFKDVDSLLAASRGFRISDEYSLWWHSKSHSERFVVRLSERFFEYAQASQVPLDWDIIRNLRSPLALDVYAWLVSRTNRTVRRRETGAGPEHIPWDRLKFQFGAEYASVDAFARRFKQALAKVLHFYPYARVQATYGGLTLLPFAATPLASKRTVSPEAALNLLLPE